MFGLGKIWFYAIAALAVVAAVTFGVSKIYNVGYGARDAQAQADSAEANRLATKASSELKDAIGALQDDKDKERHDAKVEIDSLRARVLDGTLQLRAAVRVQPGVGGSPAAPAGEARAESDPAPDQGTVAGSQLAPVTLELDPALSLELISITDAGDQAIRDLNECVDSYETLRKKLNGLAKRTD